jgi:hypothetical protein
MVERVLGHHFLDIADSIYQLDTDAAIKREVAQAEALLQQGPLDTSAVAAGT